MIVETTPGAIRRREILRALAEREREARGRIVSEELTRITPCGTDPRHLFELVQVRGECLPRIIVKGTLPGLQAELRAASGSGR